MKIIKKYVEVTARYDCAGNIRPLLIRWEDGRIFEVDRILEVRRAHSPLAGGGGMRYTCRIFNQKTYLYLDQGRWFVEAKY